MRNLNLAIRNLRRNSRRTLFTLLSTALSMFVLATLSAFSFSVDRVLGRTASSVRIAVHNKAGLIYGVPEAYKRTITALPHVEACAAQIWFGGIYQSVSYRFPNLAVDADSIEKIWPDWGVSPLAVREFKRIRVACLVGRDTMKTHHWSVGQHIMLRGTKYPAIVELTIVGTLGPSGMPDLVVFRRDYLEQAARDARVTLLWVKVDSPRYVPQVMASIDETFANSDHETLSEAEAPFMGSFLSGSWVLVTVARLLCLLVLAAMALVCANTAAMSIRERGVELAVMRSIGFAPLPLVIMLMTECVIVGLLGGLIGTAAASILCRLVAVMPVFAFVGALEVSPLLAASGIAVSIMTAAAGGFLPALGAVRRNVAEGLRASGGV